MALRQQKRGSVVTVSPLSVSSWSQEHERRERIGGAAPMPARDLQSRYAEVFGETTNTYHKDWLIKRIIWRMQVVGRGRFIGTRPRRAAELANDADLRRMAPEAASRRALRRDPNPECPAQPRATRRIPFPGSAIIRVYKGESLEVKCCPQASSSKVRSYKSLSAVAKKITGSHCNGYLFFRLTKEGGGDR